MQTTQPQLSILYLRCAGVPVADAAGPLAGSFNSLFEMHNRRRRAPALRDVVNLSILYLRCTVSARLLTAARRGAAFNSLFEMLDVKVNERITPVNVYVLSILYLRCLWRRGLWGAGRGRKTTFNSLFEMHLRVGKALRLGGRGSFQFSI